MKKPWITLGYTFDSFTVLDALATSNSLLEKLLESESEENVLQTKTSRNMIMKIKNETW